MPGLFDFLNDPQSAGLLGGAGAILNASGPSLVPRSFGQILGAGLDGMQQARAQQQAMAMRELQTKALQGELVDKEKARKDALAAQEWMRNFYKGQPGATAPAPAAPGSGTMPYSHSEAQSAFDAAGAAGIENPTTDQLNQLMVQNRGQAGQAAKPTAADPFTQRMIMAQQMRQSGIPALMAQADKLEEQALKFKPKFETKPQVVRGPDGSPMLVQTADDGTVRALPGGYGVAEKMDFRDAGGTLLGLDPYSGKQLTQFRKTQSPDSTASNGLGWARLNWDKSQAEGDGSAASEAMVDAIGQGKISPPSGFALRNPKIVSMMERVTQKYPDYDATEYAGKTKAMRDFTTGKQGDSIRSFAVATDHLTQLKGLITALNNGDTPLINKYANILAQQTGSVAPTNFDAAKGIVAKEVLKSIVAGGGGVDERQELAHLLDNAKTTKQLNGVVDTYLHLMGAQRDGLMRQYEISTGRKDAATRFNYGTAGGTHEAAPAPAAQKFDVLPPAAQFDGKRMRADSGTIYVSHGGKWVKE